MGSWGCDFEEGADGGLCKGWRQEKSEDDFDWTIVQGMTMSSGTGPTDDHTFGTWHGHFAYIEVWKEVSRYWSLHIGHCSRQLQGSSLKFI